jgi:hypothetical protein
MESGLKFFVVSLNSFDMESASLVAREIFLPELEGPHFHNF